MIISTLIILILSVFFGLIFNKRYEVLLAPVIFMLVLILYLTGMIGIMNIGMYLIYLMTFLALIYIIWNVFRKKTYLKNVYI